MLKPRQRQQMLWRLLQAIAANQHKVLELLQLSKMLPAGCPLNAIQLPTSQVH
jgi:hypothetical protein